MSIFSPRSTRCWSAFGASAAAGLSSSISKPAPAGQLRPSFSSKRCKWGPPFGSQIGHVPSIACVKPTCSANQKFSRSRGAMSFCVAANRCCAATITGQSRHYPQTRWNSKSSLGAWARRRSRRSRKSITLRDRRFTSFTSNESAAVEKFEQLGEKEHAGQQTAANDQEQQAEHCRHENPIALARALRRGDVPLKQLVVARVRLEPEGKSITHARNNADDFVCQNVERHAREKNLRQPEPRRLNQSQS